MTDPWAGKDGTKFTGSRDRYNQRGKLVGNCEFCGLAQYSNVEYHESLCGKLRAMAARIDALERKVDLFTNERTEDPPCRLCHGTGHAHHCSGYDVLSVETTDCIDCGGTGRRRP